MKHGKEEWFHEHRLMKEALLKQGKNPARFDLSVHALHDRMECREITVFEIAEVVLNGQIIGGWDIMNYPNYRNPDPLRTLVGKTSSGRLISVGIAIDFFEYSYFKVTTVYEGVKSDLRSELESIMPDIYNEFFMEVTI